MKFMEKAKRFFTLNAANHEGFTLVELIVVIAILAILAGVAVPAYSGYIKRAEKAGDLQIVGAINEAFAAACMVQNLDARQISSATLAWGGTDNKCVTGIASASGAGVDAAKLNGDFLMFFAGNTNTQFKVLYGKLFFANGVFGEGDGTLVNVFNSIISNPAYAGSITAVQGSAFAGIGSEALLGQVVDVSNMAADMIGAGQGRIFEIVMDDAYLETMASKLGKDVDTLKSELEDMAAEDPNKFAQYMANSTVLNVANTMNNMTADQETALKNDLATLNFANLGNTLNDDPETGLSHAALLYGMYTAYNPTGAKDMIETSNVQALIDLKNDEGFMAYISQINDSNSQAAKDYAGYKEAMNIVNGAANESSEAANQIMNNGYGNSDLQAMLQQVMGK